MNKTDYIRWCQRQNKNLERDILNFHKTFPVVFSPTKEVLGRDEKDERTVYKGFPPKQKLPDWLKPMMERVPGRNAYIGRPRKMADIRVLHSVSIQILGFGQEFPDKPGGRYFESIEKTPVEWAIAFDNLRKKWPRVDKITLLTGIFKPYRPSELTPSLPFEIEEWKKDLANLAHAVKIVIPIYEDTSKNDIDWKRIADLQAFIYEKRRRATPSKYELKVKVWETYKKMKNFVKVSKALGKHRTTVNGIWKTTYGDIYGSVPEGRMKEKRVIGFDAVSHADECPTCQKAKYDVDEYCSEMKAWLNEVYEPQKELTIGGVM